MALDLLKATEGELRSEIERIKAAVLPLRAERETKAKAMNDLIVKTQPELMDLTRRINEQEADLQPLKALLKAKVKAGGRLISMTVEPAVKPAA